MAAKETFQELFTSYEGEDATITILQGKSIHCKIDKARSDYVSVRIEGHDREVCIPYNAISLAEFGTRPKPRIPEPKVERLPI